MIDYKVIRSDRKKTIALEIENDGVVVRAPYYVSDIYIDKFVQGHED